MIERIRTALQKLGVKGSFSAHAASAGDSSRQLITVNGKYFGIYDTVKNTFID